MHRAICPCCKTEVDAEEIELDRITRTRKRMFRCCKYAELKTFIEHRTKIGGRYWSDWTRCDFDLT